MNIRQTVDQPASFKGGIANMVVIADSHGDFKRLPKLIKTVQNNASDIFQKPASNSTKNFFVVAGDWFINPLKKGFLTHPQDSNGDLQNKALLKTISSLEDVLNKLAAKSNEAFAPVLETLYVMGNHCLDGGEKFILDIMKKNPMLSLITNVDMENSPSMREAKSEFPNKFVKSAVYEIQDDKNPYMTHKMLFVGATVPSMDFYNPGLLEGLEFYGNCEKKDSNLTEEDMKGTIDAIKQEVENFKKANPKGVAVFVSHMGNRLSEFVSKNVKGIDHILNGHDHKNTQADYGSISIDSLGKDNEMFKSLTFEFDDDGNLMRRTVTPFFTDATVADGIENHPLKIYLDELLAEDSKPLVSLKHSEELMEDKNAFDGGAEKLTYGNEIRYKNSYLMNFLTSALKREISNTTTPDIFAVGVQSSMVRGGLSHGSNNLDVMKLFDGISESLAGVCVGEIKGEELVGLITENVRENLKAPTRNSLIQWSDIQIDRTLMESIIKGNSDAKFEDAVKVRNNDAQGFEPINLNGNYKIALGKKFLMKEDIVWAKKIRDRFEPINKTCNELFNSYISKDNYNLVITPKTKEQRIL